MYEYTRDWIYSASGIVPASFHFQNSPRFAPSKAGTSLEFFFWGGLHCFFINYLNKDCGKKQETVGQKQTDTGRASRFYLIASKMKEELQRWA